MLRILASYTEAEYKCKLWAVKKVRLFVIIPSINLSFMCQIFEALYWLIKYALYEVLSDSLYTWNTVVQWLVLLPHSRKGVGLNQLIFCVLPGAESKVMHIRVIGDSKLALGLKVYGSLSLGVSPVMHWQSVRGLPRLLPCGSWDRLQPPTTLYRRERVELMDGCTLWPHCSFKLSHTVALTRRRWYFIDLCRKLALHMSSHHAENAEFMVGKGHSRLCLGHLKNRWPEVVLSSSCFQK